MPNPPPPPPPPNQLSQLFSQAVPLLEEAYLFSQVVGQILKAANASNGPPPTYYIGETPADPSDPTPPPSSPSGGGTPVASFGDQAGGVQLSGTGYQIYVGSSAQPIAIVAGTYAGPAPVINGIPTVGAGPAQMPIAAEGSSTATGPIMDMYPDNVYIGTHPSGPPPPQKHKLYTAAGTASTPRQNDPGCYPQNAANDGRVQEYFDWFPVDYPADTFPMGPSVQKGVQNLVSQISGNHGTFAFFGYSQGAMVTCKVWRDEILNPNGQLHDRMDDFIAHVTFGNPMRSPGYANGNALCDPPLPLPAPVDGYLTGGIAGSDDLTPWQTMPTHMDFCHDGDLYADCPTGPDPWTNEAPPGLMETAIYNLVQGTITGPEGLLEVIGDVLTNPIGELVPLFEAIINGLQFLSVGLAPHQDYWNCFDPACDYLQARGQMVPARST